MKNYLEVLHAFPANFHLFQLFIGRLISTSKQKLIESVENMSMIVTNVAPSKRFETIIFDTSRWVTANQFLAIIVFSLVNFQSLNHFLSLSLSPALYYDPALSILLSFANS